ncbi:MAG: hypothetical protein A2351_04080 [Omnitrophica bacterium RIFOXYB12_FULL_50_7]|nr:MAG: hypothetical protein A2351_04080 [Omnitrophica bacterium RIFOXYB12_FULL_50_7]
MYQDFPPKDGCASGADPILFYLGQTLKKIHGFWLQKVLEILPEESIATVCGRLCNGIGRYYVHPSVFGRLYSCQRSVYYAFH